MSIKEIKVKILSVKCDFCEKEVHQHTHIMVYDQVDLLTICETCLKNHLGVINLK